MPVVVPPCLCGGAPDGWYESSGETHACPRCNPDGDGGDDRIDLIHSLAFHARDAVEQLQPERARKLLTKLIQITMEE